MPRKSKRRSMLNRRRTSKYKMGSPLTNIRNVFGDSVYEYARRSPVMNEDELVACLDREKRLKDININIIRLMNKMVDLIPGDREEDLEQILQEMRALRVAT